MAPEHDLGDLVHRLGERPGGAGPVAGPPRVGGGPDEVRTGVVTVSTVQLRPSAEPPRGDPVGAPVSGVTYPSSETDIFRTSEAMCCFLPGMDDTSCSRH